MSEDNRKSKMVIVMRKDLNMRKGKMIAQGSHACTNVILDNISEVINPKAKSAWHHWLSYGHTKICVSVDSEKELLEIFQKAKEKKLPCALIKDAGHTEFNGVATLTCLAIGPVWEEEVNLITGHLKLL